DYYCWLNYSGGWVF
nr:immunoglobulin light chain junction region [Macaca mulatta]MOW02535.1 immunoglobulin light chain junction region [Macaca mulatta]MOW03035.1 immunoglobulin light chain junction region [Macaca mulatta]MOW03333.1 immunoglobulin light chain junction region [Macaca mulatta]MOW03361.1 immunoglobulin light chain junction region [Macaca mulatta]